MAEFTVKKSRALKGRIKVPGDKSISHRAVMLSAVAQGDTEIRGLLLADDVLSTAAAFEGLGVEIEKEGGRMLVRGRGPSALKSWGRALDCGNSGTSMRLLSGLLAGIGVRALLIGDASLMKRPMKRVVDPLALMGADITCSKEGTAPILIREGARLTGLCYQMDKATAQVKSAILLAGLSARGETWVGEPGPTRDHTERMLPAFGAEVLRGEGRWVGVKGPVTLLSPGAIDVPSDFSSAAFFLVAALIVPGSDLTLESVGVNPTRTGLLDVLKEMGARIELSREHAVGDEPVADIRVRAGALTGAEVSGETVVRAIDEIPALAVAAALARGRTIIRDASELRHKESDRIAATAGFLKKMGAAVEERPDGLVIEGEAGLKAAAIDCALDHRIGMSAAVAGLAAEGETVVAGAECIATSFPDFERRLTEAVE